MHAVSHARITRKEKLYQSADHATETISNLTINNIKFLDEQH